MNCGQCGRVCESGACSNSLCDPMLVLDTPDRPSSSQYAVSVSGGQVYEWEYTTAPADPHFFVYSAPAPLTAIAQPSAGTVIQDVISGQDTSLDMSAVAFDASSIYEAAPGIAAGAVGRKKLDGSEGTGAAAALFGLPAMDPGGPSVNCPNHPVKPASALVWKNLVVAGTTAYVTGKTTANGLDFSCSDSTAIYAISPFPADASTQAVVVPGLSKLGDITTDLLVVNGHLFWFDNSVESPKRSLFTAPVTGGTPVKLEDEVYSSDHASIVSDGTYVYWTIAVEPGRLRRAPLSNLVADAATDIAEIGGPEEGLAIDEDYVYFMTVDKAVHRAPKTGGDTETIGIMLLPPAHIGERVVGVDNTFVYMSDSDGKVYRTFKTP